ncbi:nitrate reductase cytochrome c-type subunit [Campylobacter geochelonis]|uniref:Periplasmic nitrate reductase, electron transfer subunit n=1 Tax=Campylobacter geochelonis TaxID=1780362 RepID=A0A128EGZ9_9BACT|nr:nitrate reductase cytochrome c-type subunit [Campylobacter geochelonis]QKF71762.1 periplasmic nitrate reductase NapAB, small subunit, periplasmic diheme cytochrome c550 protein [Campylobacter geochelonis]CZE47568.1 periplasmic nitrate reductase%2C diheme cytochrome c subunit [Campylobacter geochelonis]CZE48495.1 periplasmic nitrate reductase%2C diheme cytochrome c subunit [Campylobacter geochelonis]CZE51180.1 periplasmic nitrate reductase%2C diheme cytochrome c subunit [Campylobacter geochel
MKKVLLSTMAVAALWAAQIDDANIGLRKANLLDENKVKLVDVNYTADAPGLATKYTRSFENAPPLISHDLEGLVPITKDLNMCITCHMPDVAKDVGATSVPKSHLVDLRTGKSDKGQLDGSRYECTICHVPQANMPVLVKNDFDPKFREESSKTSSNLLDILNQGVK